MNDDLDRYIAERIKALKARMEETGKKVWLIQYTEYVEDWAPEIVGIRSSEEGMRQAVLDVVRQFHGKELTVVPISDSTIVYTDTPIPQDKVLLTTNGTLAVTWKIQVSAMELEMDAEMEVSG